MNIGERIGDYEIVQVLGAGGMGQVYQVRNVLSNRIEAMKVLLPNLEGDPGLADRFLNEIKVQATLDHPNIAKLHTAMRTGNQLVMVMEFVDGTSLSQVLQRGRLPASAVASYASQVLDALGYAHAHGVIHRDIKPANIMLTAAGHIKLMDFGIARVQADRRLTQTGGTVGSLFYMSPEQIEGRDPDGRSDLYSLGIAMYEMVTGRRPFLGDSDFQIMSAHLRQVPMAPIEVIPGIPSGLSDIILTAIQKDPADRFQSAEAFHAALAGAFSTAVTPTRTMVPVVPPLPIMAPPPLPKTASTPAAAAPLAIPPAPARNRRGLYMALGSVLTLAVLVAAVIEVPKLMRVRAAGAQAGAQGAQNAAPAIGPVAIPSAAPEAQASPEPATQPAPAPVSTPISAPVQPRRAIPQTTAPRRSTLPEQQPAAAPAPTPDAPPTSVRTASPEMNELRDRINRVSIRAAAAQAGVRSIEQGVQRQGFGLRGDIKAASIRLDYLLQEARTSLQSGDVEGARNNLQYAEGTLRTIETFLGN